MSVLQNVVGDGGGGKLTFYYFIIVLYNTGVTHRNVLC